jgi:sugar lactone lactonase YvrE
MDERPVQAPLRNVPRAALAAVAIALAACGQPPPPVVVPRAVAAPRPAPVARVTAPLRIADVGFQTPESVLYDAAADRYLVSNVEGGSHVADGRAFIARVTPEGSVEQLRFIDGSQEATRLHAPKGMAIAGEVLYVADIDTLRKFERSTGKPLGAVPVPGATFLNDLCVGPDGAVYISDSGLSESYVGTGTDAIYRVTRAGAVEVVVRDPALAQPNGLACTDRGLYVASFARPLVQLLDYRGHTLSQKLVPKGALDGLGVIADRLYVSSWEGRGVFVQGITAATDGVFQEVATDLDAPADIGIDTRRNTLLIPLFHEDAVVLWPLDGKARAPASQ